MPRGRQEAYTSLANDFNSEKAVDMRPGFCLPAGIISLIALMPALNLQAQQSKIVIPRGESTIVLEPYAPNVVRVTLSLDKEEATAAPGYGIEAKPAPEGWSYEAGESA